MVKGVKDGMGKRICPGREEGKWGRSGRLHMVRRTGQLLDHWRAYFAADQSGRKNRKLSGRFSIPVPREHPLYFPSFFVSLRSPKSQTRTHTLIPKYTLVIIKNIYIYIHVHAKCKRFARRISACHKIHVPQDSVFLTKSNLPCGFLFLFYRCSIFCFFFIIIISFLLSNWRSSNCLNKKKKKQKQSGICRIRWSVDRFDSKIRKRIVEGERKLRRERERDKDKEDTVTRNFIDSGFITRFIMINRGGY